MARLNCRKLHGLGNSVHASFCPNWLTHFGVSPAFFPHANLIYASLARSCSIHGGDKSEVRDVVSKLEPGTPTLALNMLALRLGILVWNPTKQSELIQKEHREMSNKQKGFSLIELLIVVAIILIIAAIAIPNLLRSKMAANEASAVASLRTDR